MEKVASARYACAVAIGSNVALLTNVEATRTNSDEVLGFLKFSQLLWSPGIWR